MRQAVERYERQVRLFDGVASTTPDFVYIFDRQGRFLYANRRLLEVWGMPLSDAVGKTCRELGYEQWHHDMHLREIAQVIQTKAPIKGEVPFKAPLTGIFGVYEYIFTPVISSDGEVELIAGTTRDITERKQVEEALRRSEERFRALVTASSDVVYRMSPDWSEMRQLQGREFIADTATPSGDWLEKYIPPDDRAHVLAAINKAIRTQSVFELEHRVLRVDGSLGWTFSRAVPLLDESGEIVEWFGTASDISVRKQAEEALHIVNERLQEADRRKDEFLAMLAHELRNPLAPIRCAVQMLNLSGEQQSQLQKQREMIDRQVSHMGRLLDDLLDISRITRGKITLKREIVDLRTVATQALDSLQPMIEGRGQYMMYEAPSSPLLVDGDSTRLEQIIRNLLHNANKYTEEGGCIKLSLTLDTDHHQEWRAVVRVSDSGIGIAPDMLPIVFEAFVQAEQGLARSQGGLGVGLAMVRNLVELHGGSVEARSAGPGRGSEFVVRLPLARPDAIPGNVEKGTAESGQHTNPCRVLVVDDNEDSAASLSDLLGLWGLRFAPPLMVSMPWKQPVSGGRR